MVVGSNVPLEGTCLVNETEINNLSTLEIGTYKIVCTKDDIIIERNVEIIASEGGTNGE